MVTITDFFGWVGVLVSIIFFASPLPKFINLIKKKSKFTEINIVIIIGNYISSIVWLIYGYRIKIKQITVCYSIGALISLIWIWTYLIYMGKKKISQSLIFTILLSALTFALYIILTVIISDIKTLGEVCFIVCSLSYISPTQLLIKVLNTKDYKLIPIYSAVIASIGYGSWTLFGLFKFNANIIIPNLVGLGFSLAQIVLYRVYKNKKPLAEELGNISHSVIGAVKNVVEKTVEIANSINQTGPENKGSAPPNLGLNTTSPQNSTKASDVNFETNNAGNNNNIDTSMNFNTNLDPNETVNDKTGDDNNNNNDLPII
jgi:solute carrier family 50 protein (sugar transporter)